MGVYIEGMEMPDYGYVCLKVFANGEVQMTKVHRGALVITGIKDKVGTAVPVLPHGDLIDRDALIRDNGIREIPEYYEVVRDAPTIIEAEEDET